MPEPLKNMFNRASVGALSHAIAEVYTAFDVEQFEKSVFDALWERRELKDRMRHITTCLHDALPDNYRETLPVLRSAARSHHLDGYSFETMVFPDFVEVYGLFDWDVSIPALEQFTQQCSAEFAVRPFIVQDQPRMMAQMLEWARHENHHVRRLASEGCRPRLPWAMALPVFKRDPAPILPILETLKHDESEYVRRSVANNLNDIAKDNPQIVLDTLREWKKHDNTDMQRLISHALRTLIKAGDTQALELLGYGNSQIEVRDFSVQPGEIVTGEVISFSCEIVSLGRDSQSLMIDYVIHFRRSNGNTSAKVFKLTKKSLKPGESLAIQKKHSFQPISTRRYYPGIHAIEIQVNGSILARQ
ncbi:MAG TPA: DNA alkylation repair protein, partial [Aggregatilineales bacterium]|nr:DNA alkylation repair protein [Aggregatilineales bacterium]